MIDRMDHLVLTTAHETACIRFYVEVLGMQLETFGEQRKAFVFGAQKINLHIAGKEFEPKAQHPTPGALDVCLIASQPLEIIRQHLANHHIDIECGPVMRTGARGPIRSIYVRDPDLNLIEIAEYV
ncbi:MULTISPECIES: VOC family protein [unclassified Comamonas]|uniref:VOC family protein n=1 Tax=unclassified Comamonas TaxID=2638500 RepID=UPI00177F41DF|nr:MULTISPECIES: VOC family protein [unclassified Comamonas]MBD9403081.1 VOC family protein [Comamonas sp. CMM02]